MSSDGLGGLDHLGHPAVGSPVVPLLEQALEHPRCLGLIDQLDGFPDRIGSERLEVHIGEAQGMESPALLPGEVLPVFEEQVLGPLEYRIVSDLFLSDGIDGSLTTLVTWKRSKTISASGR